MSTSNFNENKMEQLMTIIAKNVDFLRILNDTYNLGIETPEKLVKVDLLRFLMYLSASDGIVTTEESDFMMELFGFKHLSPDMVIKIIKEENIHSAEFESKVPNYIKKVVEADNARYERSHKTDDLFSGVVSTYENLAEAIMSVDGEVSVCEKNDCNTYFSTIYSFINRNALRIISGNNDINIQQMDEKNNFDKHEHEETSEDMGSAEISGTKAVLKSNDSFNIDKTDSDSTESKVIDFFKKITRKPPYAELAHRYFKGPNHLHLLILIPGILWVAFFTYGQMWLFVLFGLLIIFLGLIARRKLHASEGDFYYALKNSFDSVETEAISEITAHNSTINFIHEPIRIDGFGYKEEAEYNVGYDFKDRSGPSLAKYGKQTLSGRYVTNICTATVFIFSQDYLYYYEKEVNYLYYGKAGSSINDIKYVDIKSISIISDKTTLFSSTDQSGNKTPYKFDYLNIELMGGSNYEIKIKNDVNYKNKKKNVLSGLCVDFETEKKIKELIDIINKQLEII